VIIFRYLIKEVLASLVAVTLVLLLIFLSNQLVRYLSYAAAGKISSSIVIQLMGFEIPYLLALLLPLGLYLGIILTYSRLYADNELPVMQACGVGQRRLIGITCWVAAAVAIVVLMLMLFVNPNIAHKKDKGLSQNTILDTLRPGRFQVLSNGRRVVYLEKISRDRQQANNLFVAEEEKKKGDDNAASPTSWVVVSAAKGYQQKEPVTNDNFIVSSEGSRYEGTPGQNDYKIINFQKYAVRVPVPTLVPGAPLEAVPSHKLWHDYDNAASAAELQWRLSMPLSALVLMLLAIPFSRVAPRKGRYTNLLPAILLYVVYVNLLFVARNWVDIKMVPIAIGMWWVHILMLGLALLLLFSQQRQRFLRLRRITALGSKPA
jgi:lipopolysaccharide export system permease protein